MNKINLNLKSICFKCKRILNTAIRQLPIENDECIEIIIETEICKHCLETSILQNIIKEREKNGDN